MQTTVVRCTYRAPSLTLTRISDGADEKNMIFSLLHDGERWGGTGGFLSGCRMSYAVGSTLRAASG